MLRGCQELLTTDDLIGGKWVTKSGYKDEEIVYLESEDKDLREYDDGM